MENKGNENKSPIKNIVRFSGLAFQMGALITIGALVGQWIDDKQTSEFPLWTLILTLFAVFTSLYIVIREVLKMNKDDDAKR